MRGIGYRRSSPGTNDDGTSLPGQTDALETWAQENDHEIVEVFTDEDVSGQKTSPLDRDGFTAAKEVLLEEDLDFIVAKTKDRYGRQMRDLFSLRVLLNELYEERTGTPGEIGVLTVSDGELDYRIERSADTDPLEQIMDFMKEMMVVFMSSYEAAQTAKKTQDSLQEKRRRDEPIGRQPWGITTDKTFYEEQQESTERLPSENFRDALAILNRQAQEDNSGEFELASGLWTEGKERGLGSPSDTIPRMWENREVYRWTLENARDNPDFDVSGLEVEW